jgi:hypothetical protein
MESIQISAPQEKISTPASQTYIGEKIRVAAVRDYGVIAKLDYAGGRIQPSAMIAERIEIVLDWQIGLKLDILCHHQSGLARAMNS